MRPHLGWLPWTTVVGALGSVAALVGLGQSARHARLAQYQSADGANAAAAAGYFSLVVPTVPSGGYRLDFLLSSANTLRVSSGWNAGLQVAWGKSSLLPDPIGLLPLDDATAARMAEGYSVVHVLTPTATVSLAPLLDRDLWNAVGWVAVWRSAPRVQFGPLTLGLGLVAVFAIAYALQHARPTERRRRRWASVLMATGASAAFGFSLGFGVRQAAVGATDATLTRAGRLIEVASSNRQVAPASLARIVPWATVQFLPGASGSSEVLREVVQGEPRALVRVPLRSGTTMEISTAPAEARLDVAWAALGGWVILLLLSLSFSAWAGAALQNRQAFRGTLAAWGFLGPAAVHLAIFAFGPVLFAGWLALHRWGLVEPVRPFVGLDNFRQVMTDPQFWHSMWVTLLYSLFVPVTMVLSLAVAVVLDRTGFRVRIIRTLLFLPFISSVVAVALVWQWMYQADFGVINAGLAVLGIRGPDWLGDPRFALIAVMALSVWANLGYQMVVFLAGLQGIPAVYHDAARVDGASAWQRFRHVTLPLLRPTILFVLVTGTIGSFQVFTYISVMTEGGPLYSTDVVVYRIYQEAWEFLRFGTASAMSLILLAVLLGLTWVQFRWLGRKVELA